MRITPGEEQIPMDKLPTSKVVVGDLSNLGKIACVIEAQARNVAHR